MDIRQLEYFLTLAEEKNITKAAEKLHMAQPPLTRQLRALEEELGAVLFIRNKRGISITEAGLVLKNQAEQIMSMLDKTKSQVWEVQNGIGGTLFIGTIELAGAVYIPDRIAEFKELYPDVKYNLWGGNTDNVLERMESGLIDIALVRGPLDMEKYDSIHIIDEKWVALMSDRHPLARNGRETVTLNELEDQELSLPSNRSREIREWFAEKNLRANVFCEFSPLMNAVMQAERNLGISICPECARDFCRNRAIVIKEISPPRTNGAYWVWKRSARLSNAGREFLKYLKKTYQPDSK